MPPRPVVTPEGVPLGFETGSVPTRLLARVIDLALQGLGALGLLVTLSFLGNVGVGDTALQIILFFAVPGLLFGYPIAWEQLYGGRTPGKRLMGLRVLTSEGAPVRFRHSLVRSLFDVLGLPLSGFTAIVAIAATPRSQRTGDLVAGTIVVRERAATKAPSALRFLVPPGVEPYAATLDVGAIGPAEYQGVRSFLLRAPSLAPASRQPLAVALANEIALRLRHSPPPWVSPELFLQVVAARVQDRSGRDASGPDAGLASVGTGEWGVAVARPAVAAAPPVVVGGLAVPG